MLIYLLYLVIHMKNIFNVKIQIGRIKKTNYFEEEWKDNF
jgi:hypothetical protein